MRIVNAILSSQSPSRSRATTDGRDLPFCKASIPMLRGVVMAASFSRIGIVLSLGAYLKMGWVHAGRVIASMAYNHAIRDRADKELVSVTVGADGDFARQQENAVSVAVLSTSPKPAIASFVDAAFKYVIWTQNSVVIKLLVFMGFRVTFSAKPSSNCGYATALNTRHFFFNLVCHGTSPKSPLYAITME